MAIVNVTVVYLALPYMDRTLHAGIADQEWIVSIYPLMEGGFTLAAGTLGDLYGRKRILTIMTWLFVLATLGCALAPNVPDLIFMRALQGLGGAALLSLPVAILIQMVPEGGDSENAIKMFSAVAGSGGIAGPIIGGVLVHFWGWQSVFYLSVLMGVIVLAAVAYASESEGDSSLRFDGLGQFLSVLSLLAVSFALIEGNASGWGSPVIVGAFVVFVVGVAAFVIVERRVPNPMVHLRYFASRPFVVGLLMIGINNFCFYGIFLLCTNFLQNVQLQSPIAAGFYLMPTNVAFFFVNQYSARFEKLLGERALVVATWSLVLAGIVWLGLLGVSAASWQVGAGLFVLGMGLGLMWTPSCALSMGACDAKDQGFAAGAVALSRSFFGVLGIALLGTLLAASMASGINGGLTAMNASPGATQAITAAIQHGGAFSIAQRPPLGITVGAMSALIDRSFVSGWRLALSFAAAITLLFGLFIYAYVPRRKTLTAASS
ncbi:MAG TPA: MFS transporter [Candidatus Baltobacteraceae bacterium]